MGYGDFRPLSTPRLLIRSFQADDAPAFAQYRSDPAVALYQGWEAPFPMAQAVEFVDRMARAVPGAAGEWCQVAIQLRSSATMIGDVGIHIFPDGRQGEIGFTLASLYQGQGYAFEATLSVLKYMFDQLGLHRIEANCDPRNARSVRLLERLGMRREGHTVESLWSKGEWVDELWFAILAREWRERGGG